MNGLQGVDPATLERVHSRIGASLNAASHDGASAGQAAAGVPHGWSWAWWGLALAGLLAAAGLAWPVRMLQQQELPAHDARRPEADLASKRLPWRAMAPD